MHLFRKSLIFFLLSLLLLTKGVAFGAVEGKLDSLIQVDNRLNESELSIIEEGDFLYKEKGIVSALSFSVRKRESGSDETLYQLYIEKEIDDRRIKVGRYEQATASGYYILDGISYKKRSASLSVNLFGGIPITIGDYFFKSGDSLFGIELGFTNVEKVILATFLKDIHGKVGFERFRDGEAVNRVTWIVGNTISEKKSGFDSWHIYTGGSIVPQSNLIERAQIEVEGYFKKDSLFRIGYEIFEPNQEVISFRDNFYRFYSIGREEVIRGSLHYSPLRGVHFFGKGRKVSHESGASGFGGTLGVDLKNRGGINLAGEVDYLYLESEKVLSLILSSKHSLGSKTLMAIEGIWQLQQKRTTGKNRGFGLEAELKQMVKSYLFVSAYAMHIWNSRMDNEYEAGARLSWRFNKGGKK